MTEGIDLLLSSSKIRSNEEIESHLKSLSNKPFKSTISKMSSQDDLPQQAQIPTNPDEEQANSSSLPKQEEVDIVDQQALVVPIIQAEDSAEFQSREMVLNIIEET
mmetsp:Transcript_1446/g.1951  ORF Transcript_1446/g.1951 Transcript_1446/m.1951 type:complete len:106 (-) Transcript_1446:64-381(-)